MAQVFNATEAKALLANVMNDAYPDERGRFGPFGGRYVPETLVPALDRLQEGVDRYLNDPAFLEDFHAELKSWVGRPTPLTSLNL
jgi:tryptophan synthase beta chain